MTKQTPIEVLRKVLNTQLDYKSVMYAQAIDALCRVEDVVAALRRAALGQEPQVRGYHDPPCDQCCGCAARKALARWDTLAEMAAPPPEDTG